MVIEAKKTSLPDHTQLPFEDGTFVFTKCAEGKNFQEHPQSLLLTDSIHPRLQQIHPDGQYCIGQDCGIYWRVTQPPENGAEVPDWFYVPNVPPTLNGELRRSYVLYQELIAPFIVLEFVSGNGDDERDKTPYEGKFWIYENVIRPAYYGIYEEKKASVEVYELVAGKYQKMQPNVRGHYSIPQMGVELGIWKGYYLNANLPWLRWWNNDGILLPTGEERAEAERQRAQQAEQENARLREKLRSLGIDPDAL